MIAIWNDACGHIKPTANDIPPEAIVKRAARLLLRLKDSFGGDMERWRAYCARVARSAFLRGDTGWHGMTLSWCIKPENLTKIMEGTYDDAGTRANSTAHVGSDLEYPGGFDATRHAHYGRKAAE